MGLRQHRASPDSELDDPRKPSFGASFTPIYAAFTNVFVC